MSLPVPNLDDRSFQQLVDEAKRLIPTYCPEWTNHNLSDPGVALIELFAWMSEMMLFRLNQVPDGFYMRMLNLLGIETFPASAASADLTFWASSGQDTARIAAGTEIATSVSGTEDPIVFTTVGNLEIVDPVLDRLMTSAHDDVFVDLTTSVSSGQMTPLFSTNPLRTGDGFYLGFDRSLAGNVLELQIRATVQGIGIDPTDPPIAWEVWTGEGWARITVHEDTTGGFNRDGFVKLLIPMAHEPLTLGQHAGFWVRVVLTRGLGEDNSYRVSPVVTAITARTIGGTIRAEHALLIGEEFLGVSSGEPDQMFQTVNRPVLERREGETIEVVDEAGVAMTWLEVADFQHSGPDDMHFVWDDATGEVHFGPRIRYPDGSYRQHGAAPSKSAVVRASGYRYGGGAGGNVGARTLVAPRASLIGIAGVENLTPASGGVDAETVENAKHRGPMTVRAGGRAVTVEDYERLAHQADPSIARARCLPPLETGGPTRLLLVPNVEGDDLGQRKLDDFAIAADVEQRVQEYLDRRRILGTSVAYGTPYFQGASVAALIGVLPGRPPEAVRARATEALYRFIDPLVGGPDGNGWPFGLDLNAAAVTQLLADVDGVERVDDVVLFQVDVRNENRRYGDAHEVLRLTNRALFLSARHQVVVR